MSNKKLLLASMMMGLAAVGIDHNFDPRKKHKPAPHWKETQTEEWRSEAIAKAEEKRLRKAQKKQQGNL